MFSTVWTLYHIHAFSLTEVGGAGEAINSFNFLLIWISEINFTSSLFNSLLPSPKIGITTGFMLTCYRIRKWFKENFLHLNLKNMLFQIQGFQYSATFDDWLPLAFGSNLPSILFCQLYQKHSNQSKQFTYISDCFLLTNKNIFFYFSSQNITIEHWLILLKSNKI